MTEPEFPVAAKGRMLMGGIAAVLLAAVIVAVAVSLTFSHG